MTQTEKKSVIFRQAGLRYDKKKFNMITVLSYKCNKELTNLPISLEILSQSSFFVNEISAFFQNFLKKSEKIGFQSV